MEKKMTYVAVALVVLIIAAAGILILNKYSSSDDVDDTSGQTETEGSLDRLDEEINGVDSIHLSEEISIPLDGSFFGLVGPYYASLVSLEESDDDMSKKYVSNRKNQPEISVYRWKKADLPVNGKKDYTSKEFAEFEAANISRSENAYIPYESVTVSNLKDKYGMEFEYFVAFNSSGSTNNAQYAGSFSEYAIIDNGDEIIEVILDYACNEEPLGDSGLYMRIPAGYTEEENSKKNTDVPKNIRFLFL